ncbi:hypothetical protein [Nocardioides ultimimeridianus]
MKYVGIAVLLLLLVGCGGDPQPRFSPSPTVSPPTTTAAAVETPQEFLRRWVHAMDAMERTGNPAAWQRMNLRRCKSCSVAAEVVKAVYAAGRKVVGGQSRIVSIGRAASGRWHVRTVSRPSRIVDQSGTVKGSFPGGPTMLEITLVKQGDGLRVATLIRVVK